MNKQLGFAVAELGIICVVVFIVGILGYVFYDRVIDGVTTTETAQVATPDDVPTIASTDDLSKAEALLDEASLDGGDEMSQLEAELASFE